MWIRDITGPLAASSTTRRRAAWLAGSVLFWLLALGWPTPVKPAATADEAAPVPSSVNPADALQRLKDGNQRFVAGKPLHQRQNAAHRAELVAAQHPFAAILGCSDSRVPLEIVFDQGLGDLFAVRVAGNVAGGDERGSLQYAVAHLHVPLLVVLGHERCGAVSAALSPPSELAKEADGVQELVARIDSQDDQRLLRRPGIGGAKCSDARTGRNQTLPWGKALPPFRAWPSGAARLRASLVRRIWHASASPWRHERFKALTDIGLVVAPCDGIANARDSLAQPPLQRGATLGRIKRRGRSFTHPQHVGERPRRGEQAFDERRAGRADEVVRILALR